MKKIIIFLLVVGIGAFLFIGKGNNNKIKNNHFPQQYVADRDNYTKVKQLFNDAMDLTKPPDDSSKSFDMPKSQQQKILTNLAEGINLSKQIDDNFLDYLNPELKTHFRNQYIKGYSLLLEGMSSDTTTQNSIGVKDQLEGNQLIGEYNNWWDVNKDQIINKAFPK